MPRPFRPILLAVVLVIMTAQVALGAKPSHEKFVIDETFQEELCGIDVTTHVVVKVNALGFEDRFVDLSQVRITFTNEDGDWLQNFAAGRTVFTEQLDGDILTFTERHTGVQERLRSSDGITAAFDRGQIVFRTVIDLGDPEDDEDDVVLGFDVIQHGPHPEADSDFALFCDVVTDVLG